MPVSPGDKLFSVTWKLSELWTPIPLGPDRCEFWTTPFSTEENMIPQQSAFVGLRSRGYRVVDLEVAVGAATYVGKPWHVAVRITVTAGGRVIYCRSSNYEIYSVGLYRGGTCA